MKRRTLLKSTGIAALSLSVAGCSQGPGDEGEDGGDGGDGGNGEGNQTDQGDEPIVPQNPGWFDLEGTVLSDNNAEGLTITQHSLYRTPEAFGVMGTIENTGNEPYVRVVAHARLKNDQGEIDVFERAFDVDEDQVSFDDLAPGETLRYRIRFEDTDPSIFEDESLQYETWVTGEVQEGAGNEEPNGNESGGGNESNETA